MTPIQNQSLALAGVFQAATLVNMLSINGKLDQRALDCSYHSLFTFESTEAMEIFGGLENLQVGMNTLNDQLSGQEGFIDKSVAYYVLSMLKIASRLKSNNKMASQIFNSLQSIQTLATEFEQNNDNIYKKIDGLYQDTISHLRPRIMVQGDQNYLTNDYNARKIRVLLLAGIRSAVLWHQLGGKKWYLLIFRKRFLRSIQGFLLSEQL